LYFKKSWFKDFKIKFWTYGRIVSGSPSIDKYQGYTLEKTQVKNNKNNIIMHIKDEK